MAPVLLPRPDSLRGALLAALTSAFLLPAQGIAGAATTRGPWSLSGDRLLLGRSVAIDPLSGRPWVVRCVGHSERGAQVDCRHRSLQAALQAGGSDVILLANGLPEESLAGRSLPLPPRTTLAAADQAPSLATQFGPVALAEVFGASQGSRPTLRDGVLHLASRTTVAGLHFRNLSLVSLQGSSHLTIRTNQLEGSFTDRPGRSSSLALPTILLQGARTVRIEANTLLTPQVASYPSSMGRNRSYGPSRPDALQWVAVCGSRGKQPAPQEVLCLSGNAIRLVRGEDQILRNNRIEGALDEAIRVDNPSGRLRIESNTIRGMRMGPDSNMQAAIFLRQSTGTSNVSVVGNRVEANRPGRLDASLQVVPGEENVVDPFEIGLCRGRTSFGDANDLYGDEDTGSQGAIWRGDCPTGAGMTLEVRANSLNPLPATPADPQDFDSDGIDFNVGQNGSLSFRVRENEVKTALMDRANGKWTAVGNPFTADLRGNARVYGAITANRLFSTGPRHSAIDVEVSNRTGGGFLSNGEGSIEIRANTTEKENQPVQLTRSTTSALEPVPRYRFTVDAAFAVRIRDYHGSGQGVLPGFQITSP